MLRCGPTHPHTAQILSGRVVIPPQIVEPIDDTRRHCQCKVTHKHSREIAREDEPLRRAIAFLIDLQRRRRVIWLVRPAHGLAEPTTTTAGHGNYCRETYDTFIWFWNKQSAYSFVACFMLHTPAKGTSSLKLGTLASARGIHGLGRGRSSLVGIGMIQFSFPLAFLHRFCVIESSVVNSN